MAKQVDTGFMVWNSNCYGNIEAIKLLWQVDTGFMVWNSNCYGNIEAIKLLWQVDTGCMAWNSNCYGTVVRGNVVAIASRGRFHSQAIALLSYY